MRGIAYLVALMQKMQEDMLEASKDLKSIRNEIQVDNQSTK